MKNKIAFVLSGGGTKGAFQAGVISQLYNHDINPNIIYGSSIGAINAFLYQRTGASGLMEIWTNIYHKSQFLFPTGSQWFLGWLKFLTKQGRTGIYSQEPLRKIIEHLLSQSPSTNIDIVVTSTDLLTGKLEYHPILSYSGEHFIPEFYKQYIVRSILSSSAIPAVIESVDDRVDGAVKEMAPLSRAIKDGYTNIVLISNNPLTDSFRSPRTTFNLVRSAAKSLSLISEEILRNDIMVCHHRNQDTSKRYRHIDLTVYCPQQPLLGSMEFDQAKISKAIQAGQSSSPLSIEKLKTYLMQDS